MSSLFFENPLQKEELVRRERPRREDIRGAYFRDTTAIIHSYPFRRLKHKTQVFFAPDNDHICTRIEHVMHVSTVAATICKALNLEPELAWAVGLGHDLGHTPFGHVGEKILESILVEKGGTGFAHEIYSLRVVDRLAGHGKGLNLTYAVRDGIINHCGEKFEQAIRPDFRVKDLAAITDRDRYPSTWEGCVVRMSDKIAYIGRDLEDAIQLRIIRKEDVPETARRMLGSNNGEIIDSLVGDVIESSLACGCIGFSDRIYGTILELKDFNYRNIYLNPILADYHRYFERILRTLFGYLEDVFARYAFDVEAYRREHNILAVRFADYLSKMEGFYKGDSADTGAIVFDYLAGMTDDYALKCVTEIMVPTRFESQFSDLLMKK